MDELGCIIPEGEPVASSVVRMCLRFFDHFQHFSCRSEGRSMAHCTLLGKSTFLLVNVEVELQGRSVSCNCCLQ